MAETVHKDAAAGKGSGVIQPKSVAGVVSRL
jgi:hypothetical protein